VHERPDPLKLEALASFAAHLSIPFRYDPAGIRPRDIQALLGKAEGRPEHPILSQVVLRSMKQARYSAENVGHFGLAAPVYCHFTSPIRRYPDLVVHRLLRAVRSGRRVDAPEDLSELADSCSRLERAAEQAEREVLLWRKIAFMKGREGDTFEGIVTGVTRYGLFIQLTESLVEGLLHVQQLGEEYFTFDEKRLELRGERAGKRYRLGDRLEVVVARVDTVLRRIDLTLVGGELQERRRGPRTARAARPGARRAGASEAAGAGPARGRRKTTSRTGRKHGNAKQGRKR
jgi:ribonuclease R